jgi:hypothetical protein
MKSKLLCHIQRSALNKFYMYCIVWWANTKGLTCVSHLTVRHRLSYIFD